ncbi:hypothetical protein JCGZ_03093 [Jatropha curcas]|uniref:Uncharacterized protein n=1 Tax=Jatropha curcas TaxID=180498 RepID=A0A067LC05_JATCU|nr:hypothetical protein JCGZ_03093 [Jatropha curcas]
MEEVNAHALDVPSVRNAEPTSNMEPIGPAVGGSRSIGLPKTITAPQVCQDTLVMVVSKAEHLIGSASLGQVIVPPLEHHYDPSFPHTPTLDDTTMGLVRLSVNRSCIIAETLLVTVPLFQPNCVVNCTVIPINSLSEGGGN